jgi:mannitol-1-phosphate/altronate dehydrogenase
MNHLSKAALSTVTANPTVSLPDVSLFALPEKVIQFGTGVLLRGLPDYFIDKANRQGIFNGRVVVVKSTDGGDSTAFERQDSLYTIGIEGVFIRPDIDLFRELKLRLLNGTHTLTCGLAYLSGFETVRGSMDDDLLSAFIGSLMLAELLPGIPYTVDEQAAQQFGMQVLDRFRNPYIEHRWLSISAQLTAKMQMRNIPTLLHYYRKLGVAPRYIALGFAGYLLFMRATHQKEQVWFSQLNGNEYPIRTIRRLILLPCGPSSRRMN